MVAYNNLPELAQALVQSQHPLIVTGAGLSVASGLAAYRKGPDAVWSRFITEWGTARMFYEKPLEWWSEFWLKAHTPEQLHNAQPNPGHFAISDLAELLPNSLVITQNIDRLHLAAGLDPQRLIEIHGAAGLYRCTSGFCPRFQEPTENLDQALIQRGELPLCDLCGDMLRPLVLLFDEIYISHPFFQAKRAFGALEKADLFLFVGTSLSVGFTASAIAEATSREAPAFNINIEEIPTLTNVLGPGEEVLPAVVVQVREALA